MQVGNWSFHFKVEPIGLFCCIEYRCEEARTTKDDFKVLVLSSHSIIDVAIFETNKELIEGERLLSFCLAVLSYSCLLESLESEALWGGWMT